jgi:hypothetical protein
MPYVNLNSEIFDRPITLRQGYQIMAAFIAQYHARGESSTVALVADTGIGPSGETCDPAQIYDYLRVAGDLLGDVGLRDAAMPA